MSSNQSTANGGCGCLIILAFVFAVVFVAVVAFNVASRMFQ